MGELCKWNAGTKVVRIYTAQTSILIYEGRAKDFNAVAKIEQAIRSAETIARNNMLIQMANHITDYTEATLVDDKQILIVGT